MVLTTALVIGILVAVNLLSSLFYTGKDFTHDRVSSISEQSQKVIKWIKDPLTVLVFTSKDNDFEKYLLDSYNFYNKHITYKMVDPEKNPQTAQDYGVTKTGQAVVTFKDGRLLIPSVTEQGITNAIVSMTQPAKNVVYFMMGHGEHPLDDVKSNQGYGLLWRELVAENYDVHQLKLEAPNYYIPGDCTILIVAGPRKKYTEMEAKAIDEYLEAGGRAILLLDPNVDTGLEPLLARRNIMVDNDCMVDFAYPSLVERVIAQMNGQRAEPKMLFKVLVKDFPEHEITKDLEDKSVLMSVVRSVSVKDWKVFSMDVKIEPLASTTQSGWAETDLDALFKRGAFIGNMQTHRGPKVVAMLYSKGSAEANSKVIVIGNSGFINNEFVHQLYNRDFFMNCMAYMSSQAVMISVRPRHMFASRLDYDPVTMSRIFTGSVLVFPQLLLMAGISLWWLRRQ
jgi:hypothetical protein